MEHNNGGIYAILDIVADAIVGILTIHRHDASAIRFFGDVAADSKSNVAQHPRDFNLIRLGYLSTDHRVVPAFDTIITGAQWAAAQQDAKE